MHRADKILYDYYVDTAESAGQTQALEGLRKVIIKGIDFLVRRPEARKAKRVALIVDSVRKGTHLQLVEEIAAGVQDDYKEAKGKFLVGFDLDGGKVRVDFLPDVMIPSTEENAERWKGFLQMLDPKRRRGKDPKTGLSGRIPFRDGVWFSDLVFAPRAPLAVIPDITDIKGSLSVEGIQMKHASPFSVQGDLRAPVKLVEKNASPVTALGGDMHLADPKVRNIGDLPLPPEKIEAWGLRPGRRLLLGKQAFVLSRNGLVGKNGENQIYLEEQGKDGPGEEARLYRWTGAAWERVRAELPIEVANQIRAKLGRARVYLGLGKELLPDHTDHNLDNLRRVAVYLELLRLAERGGVPAFESKETVLFAALEDDLRHLLELARVTGKETPDEMDRRIAEVGILLETITEERLRSLQDLAKRPRDQIDLSAVRSDRRYLDTLDQEALNIDDVLVSGGKTLVFLNNVFASREAKSRAAAMISELRKILRGLNTGEDDADSLLVELLKWSDQDTLKRLRRENKEAEEAVAELEQRLRELDKKSPLDMVEDFQLASYDSDSAELGRDKAFLAHLSRQRMGAVDQLFDLKGPDGKDNYEVDKFRNALWVNLRSFILGEVKRRNKNFDDKTPRAMVAWLRDKLDFREPLIKAYNNQAGG